MCMFTIPRSPYTTHTAKMSPLNNQHNHFREILQKNSHTCTCAHTCIPRHDTMAYVYTCKQFVSSSTVDGSYMYMYAAVTHRFDVQERVIHSDEVINSKEASSTVVIVLSRRFERGGEGEGRGVNDNVQGKLSLSLNLCILGWSY